MVKPARCRRTVASECPFRLGPERTESDPGATSNDQLIRRGDRGHPHPRTSVAHDGTNGEIGETSTRRWVFDLVGVAIVCLVVLAGYFEIPFEGKTFSTSAQVLSARNCATATGACVPCRSRTREWILALRRGRSNHGSGTCTSTWRTTTYRSGTRTRGWVHHSPRNMQSSVFDPFFLAVHLHPTCGARRPDAPVGLMLIGVAAYFAARMLRLGVAAAVLAGSVYGLSGWFFSTPTTSGSACTCTCRS